MVVARCRPSLTYFVHVDVDFLYQRRRLQSELCHFFSQIPNVKRVKESVEGGEAVDFCEITSNCPPYSQVKNTKK